MRITALVALALLAMLTTAARATDTIRLIAVDVSGSLDDTDATDLPDLYIGSSVNGWDPAGTRSTGKHKRNGRAQWTFNLPRAFVTGDVEFKFTLGSWETVETARDGSNIANRTLMFPTTDEVVVEIGGFNAGARGPAAAAIAAGSLDVFAVESKHLGRPRTVRVWLPEQYAEDGTAHFPVLYMHDGQNLFDPTTSFAGEWGADDAVTDLARDGTIPPTIVVGIDNSDARRSWDYLPFPPGNRRPDMPGGGADTYVSFLIDELMPLINNRYRTKTGPDHTAVGGSSFGGVITLHTVMTRPGVFGSALVESPSLWVGDGMLLDAIHAHAGPWPDRVFMAMGTLEYGNPEHDATLLTLVDHAERALRAKGLDESRLKVVIEEGARHNEPAWRNRLPGALTFLLAPHAAHSQEQP